MNIAKTISKTKKNLESLEHEYPGIKTIHQDLADWNETRGKIEALPTFELLVNNAGLGDQNSFLNVPEEEMDKWDWERTWLIFFIIIT